MCGFVYGLVVAWFMGDGVMIYDVLFFGIVLVLVVLGVCCVYRWFE